MISSAGNHKFFQKVLDLEMVLAEPLRVSPLIKTCRWTALLVGIWWGNKRWQENKVTEDEHRAYVAKMQPIWDAEKAEKAAKVRDWFCQHELMSNCIFSGQQREHDLPGQGYWYSHPTRLLSSDCR